MEELLVELDKINTRIGEEAFNVNGTIKVSEKWLNLFNTTIIELIETKNILDFANQKKQSKWEHILGILKEMDKSN